MARFRVNGYRDMNGYCTVLRVIPEVIPTFEELNLPEVMRTFCMLSKGLVIITGPTGSGKSTTLAAMIDYINQNRNEHIITIEDPIEFVHTPKNASSTSARYTATPRFAHALRAALREDPDIVLVVKCAIWKPWKSPSRRLRPVTWSSPRSTPTTRQPP